MNEKKNNDNNPDINLKRKIKITNYVELLILLFLCCSNNFSYFLFYILKNIIKEKKKWNFRKIKNFKRKYNFLWLDATVGKNSWNYFIIIYFLSNKDCLQTKYIIALTTIFKSISFLIYCLDLSKIYKWVIIASIILQSGSTTLSISNSHDYYFQNQSENLL